MSYYYQLFDYESTEWVTICDEINEKELKTLDDVKLLISNLGRLSDDVEYKTLDILRLNQNVELIAVVNDIKEYALKLPDLFPIGNIPRLNQHFRVIEFTRRQVICLLCHMLLCTLKKSKRNLYWVTFENWLCDGRVCAVAYLHTLVEFLRESLSRPDTDDDYMNEKVIFKRNRATDLASIDNDHRKLSNVNLRLDGSIGDEPYAEVDFANADIGYGITGSQEEMLFAASPELCIAMLFCDTLDANDAVIVTGARRVVEYEGYGYNVSIKSFIPHDRQEWKTRCVIAIDALDYSDEMESTIRKQLENESITREIAKAYSGFSASTAATIQTGHWGCGAFGGCKQIKALIQLAAATASNKSLLYYCHGDDEFYEDFSKLLFEFDAKKTTLSELWFLLMELQKHVSTDEEIDEKRFYEHLINKIN